MKFLLVFLTIYLIIRYMIPSIFKIVLSSLFKTQNRNQKNTGASNSKKKKTSDKYGEYIDYEDID